MADTVDIAVVGPGVAKISSEEVTTLNAGTVAAQQVQRILLAFRTADATAVDLPGDLAFGMDVDITRLPAVALDAGTLAALENLTVTVANPGTGQATEVTLAALLAGVDGLEGKDYATQATLAAVLAKLIAAPATEAAQTAAQSTLAAILAKLSTDPATQTTLAAVLAKISADPATQTTLAAVLTKLGAVTLDAGTLAALESITIGTALPAGTNAIGTVDLAAATPTAIVDAATVSATRYIGVTVCETSGSAAAKVRVRNQNVSGVILDSITLQANESVSYTYPRGRSAASGTIYLQVVSGAVEGSVFSL